MNKIKKWIDVDNPRVTNSWTFFIIVTVLFYSVSRFFY